MSELVSIITPSYNSAAYIAEMIESILAQTYTNWELLITDDCSTDDSVKIIESYATKDSRIKYSGSQVIRELVSPATKSDRRKPGDVTSPSVTATICGNRRNWKNRSNSCKKNGYEFVYCKSDVIDTEGNVIAINNRVRRVSYFARLL